MLRRECVAVPGSALFCFKFANDVASLPELYGLTAEQLSFRDLFYVQYGCEEGQQAELSVHEDGSPLSFNILISDPNDFQGGGTYFEAEEKVLKIKQVFMRLFGFSSFVSFSVFRLIIEYASHP